MDQDLLRALKAFTGPDRLRMLGILAGGSRTTPALAGELGLPLARVARDVALLRRAGLIQFDRNARTPAHALAIGRLHALGRALDALEPSDGAPAGAGGPDLADVPREDVKVLRAFFEGSRLTSIPAQDAKRIVVLRYLRERCFAEDREYPEKEVNQRLALVHPDVAALRRYLVDSRLMTRAGGVYRRGRSSPAEPADPGSDRPERAPGLGPAGSSGANPEA